MSGDHGTILIVDDEAEFVASACDDLTRRGHRCVAAGSLSAARAALDAQRFDVVLLDGRLPDGDGLGLVAEAVRAHELTKIILISGYPTFEHAQSALRSGAISDYFAKPLDWPAVLHAIERGLRVTELERGAVAAQERHRRAIPAAPSGLDGLIKRAAESNVPVLLTGPTGCGKTRTAHRIHGLGGPARPFISVNCAAIPAALFEAELFGVERGAFTGATEARPGLIELAERGTLLLDEIAEMPSAMQAKLLGIIEERTMRRVGSARVRPVDCRIIAATHRDVTPPSELLREDLYYRVSVLRIDLPALQVHGPEFEAMVRAVLAELADGRSLELASGELEALRRHGWPGNIRELRNVLERSILFADGAVLHPSQFLGAAPRGEVTPPRLTLAELERQHILAQYREHAGDLRATSEALGISLSTLRRRLAGLAPSPE